MAYNPHQLVQLIGSQRYRPMTRSSLLFSLLVHACATCRSVIFDVVRAMVARYTKVKVDVHRRGWLSETPYGSVT